MNKFVFAARYGAMLTLSPGVLEAEVKSTGAYWDWQLDSPVDYSVDVEVLVMDLMETTPRDIAELKARVTAEIGPGEAPLEAPAEDEAAEPSAVDDTLADLKAKLAQG